MATKAAERSARSLKDRDVVRVTADVPTRDANLLAELARRTGYNKVTTLLRAIRILDVLEKAQAEGADLIIINRDGSRERLVLR